MTSSLDYVIKIIWNFTSFSESNIGFILVPAVPPFLRNISRSLVVYLSNLDKKVRSRCIVVIRLNSSLIWNEIKTQNHVKDDSWDLSYLVAAWTRTGFTWFSQNREGHLSKRSWIAGQSLTTSVLLIAKDFSIFSLIALSLFFFFSKSSLSFSKVSSVSPNGSGGR